VITPIVEPYFSECSYGFRPGRRAGQAIIKLLEYLNDGYTYIVDIDLEKFFDNVPHDKLMTLVGKIIKDPDTESLISKYLKTGVMVKDDCVIAVRSSAAANRVMHTITKWIERKLGLKVNMTKTRVTKPSNLKYLGFGFVKMGDRWEARPHQDSVKSQKKSSQSEDSLVVSNTI